MISLGSFFTKEGGEIFSLDSFSEKVGQEILSSGSFSEKVGQEIFSLGQEMVSLGQEMYLFDHLPESVSTNCEAPVPLWDKMDTGNLNQAWLDDWGSAGVLTRSSFARTDSVGYFGCGLDGSRAAAGIVALHIKSPKYSKSRRDDRGLPDEMPGYFRVSQKGVFPRQQHTKKLNFKPAQNQ